MTTIRTASGRTAELPAHLELDRVVGLDFQGRIVVDDFGALTGNGSHLFGLSLCCNAYDKGTEDGTVCRGCYGTDEVGAYLFPHPETGGFPQLDPIVPEAPALILVGTATGFRLHRGTCKRATMRAQLAAEHITPAGIRGAKLATCCKPTEAMRAAELEGSAYPDRPAVWLAEPCTDDNAPVDMEVVAADRAIPAIGDTSEGRGELAGGDVQALPRTAKPRTRKGNRHDQRTALPRREGGVIVVTPERAAETGAALVALASTQGTQTCTGACGQTLPLTKFPTTPKGRGTECRADRDARRAQVKQTA